MYAQDSLRLYRVAALLPSAVRCNAREHSPVAAALPQCCGTSALAIERDAAQDGVLSNMRDHCVIAADSTA